jgi:ribosomal protein L19
MKLTESYLRNLIKQVINEVSDDWRGLEEPSLDKEKEKEAKKPEAPKRHKPGEDFTFLKKKYVDSGKVSANTFNKYVLEINKEMPNASFKEKRTALIKKINPKHTPAKD